MPIPTTNRLVSELPGDIRHRLHPHLNRVKLKRDDLIYTRGQHLEHVLFIETGVASLTWPAPPRAIDVAIIGPEGLVGHGAALGSRQALFGTIARTDLIGLRMEIIPFQGLLRESPEFNAAVFRFVRSVSGQIADCAYSNARATVEQRLARWIALASERLSSVNISFTHDCLAAAIGCRRAGVTVALHMLEGERIIKARRSRVTIIDPDRLRHTANAAWETSPFSCDASQIPHIDATPRIKRSL